MFYMGYKLKFGLKSQERKTMNNTRRNFLKFIGASTYSLTTFSLLSSKKAFSLSKNSSFPSSIDNVVLKEGLSYYPIISWGDKMNKNEVFGFNNDYIDLYKLSKDKLIMWVNHEYVNPIFVSSKERTKENVDIERTQVGGSLIQLDLKENKWVFNSSSKYNKGIRGTTKIPFANNVEIRGSKFAEGTVSNCAGGKTPWNTFLTCEENYNMVYGERNKKTDTISSTRYQWEKFYPLPPEHYGWVVEIDPLTAQSKKHTNLGRFAHESATCILSSSNKACVYSGDDKADEHLYKFVSNSKSNFDRGILYVANINDGKWLPIDLSLSPILKKHFKSHIDLMINTREAAKLLGATPLNRPEDIEIHPITKEIYVALTNNKQKKDYFGKILKISENNSDHSGTTFKAETFILGGEMVKMACPDNLAFDQKGNLWVATDISTGAVNKKPYQSFGNNGIFVIPTSGEQAGSVIQVASGPNDSEFTGLKFSPDQKTLFVSVQHPGEGTKDLSTPTSTWPTGALPKPTVIAIEGEYLNEFTQK
jgi:secreted PhoX family phosphatase